VSEGIEERDGEGGLGRSTLPGWRERRLLSRSMLQSMADAAGIRSNSIDDDAADGGVVCLVCRAAAGRVRTTTFDIDPTVFPPPIPRALGF
jgi:hypothetical protein